MAARKDDSQQVDDADDAAIAGIRERMQQATEEPDEPDAADEPDEVPPEPVEDESGETVQLDDEEPSRREKRRARGRMREENERLRQREEELLRQTEMTQRQIAEMANLMREQNRPPEPPDNTDAEILTLRKRQTDLNRRLQAYGDKLTQDDVDSALRENEDIEEKIFELRAKKRGYARQQDIPRFDPDQYEIMRLRRTYQDVENNPNAVMAARAYYFDQRAKGRQDSPDLAQEAYEHARQRFNPNHRPRSKPNAALRDKLTSVRGGPSSEGAASRPTTYKIPPEEIKAMNAHLDHIKDEKERRKVWAKQRLAAIAKRSK